jgi:hypothetical protein
MSYSAWWVFGRQWLPTLTTRAAQSLMQAARLIWRCSRAAVAAGAGVIVAGEAKTALARSRRARSMAAWFG